MRTVFLLVLLANVAFFAWARYISPFDGGADPAPLGRQIEPEKLRIVSPDEIAAPIVAKPAPAPAPAPAPVATAAPAPAAAPVTLKCVEWGSFTLADAPRAEKTLEPLALGARLTQRRSDETAPWWVFIPAQPDRQSALRKAAELKKLGVEDYFVVQDEGPQRWAVSLGVFRTEEAAQARLAALRAQGVRTAQLGERETVVPRIWLQVKDADATLQARLKEAARSIEGSELRECAQ